MTIESQDQNITNDELTHNLAEPARTSPQAASPATATVPTAKPKKRSGVTCLVIAVIIGLLLIVGGSTCVFMAVVAADSAPAHHSDKVDLADFDTRVIDAPDFKSHKGSSIGSSDKGVIAFVPMSGVISDGSADIDGSSFVTPERMQSLLDYLAEKENVKGIILDINSPGGGVTASDKLYHQLVTFKEKHHIPIVALFEDMACSGGYYAAMSSDYIVAHPTTFTGSIGVIMETPEISVLLKKLGVSVNTITSLNDKGQPSFKDIGSMYRKMKPQERALLQTMITQTWHRFVGIVADGRSGKIQKKQVYALADGRIFTAEQALKLKLIDSIGYKEAAYAKARELAKAPQSPIVRYAPAESFSSLFTSFIQTAAGQRQASALLNYLEPSFTPQYRWNGPAGADF